MSRIRIKLEYDGTNFVGWQFQTNGRSVQEEIEKALRQILQVDVRITGGGRTDSGVHARGQVASFSIEKEVDINTLAKSMNAVLPHDVVVHDAKEVPLDFNARYSAKRRQYKYYINQEPTAIGRDYCWQVFYKLDVKLMQKCAELILGEHEFISFCKGGTDTDHHRCIVYSAGWAQEDKSLIFEITSNRFLYGMVRALVGTMVDVGREYTKVEEFEKMIETKNQEYSVKIAPAKGLFLEEIIY